MSNPRKLIFAMFALAAIFARAAFNDDFAERTLRLDYIFAGDAHSSAVYLEEMGVTDGWAGRRVNLDAPLLRGNGDITVRDAATGRAMYANSFSTLFQEWQSTSEASRVAKAFEATYLVPMPLRDATVTVNLYDNRGNTLATLTHDVSPDDVLIRAIPHTRAENRYIHNAGAPEQCIDIAIVAEGYTEAEKDKFFADAARASEALLTHEPFASMADRFNILAVATVSGDSGPDVPHEGVWQRTAHRSHFTTFYIDRYLTTQAIHEINESVAGLPYEHIILLVNTPRYGGGGIFNQITVATSDHPTFKEVVVHEFGHAYAGLADEYYTNGIDEGMYPHDIEPWEPNITTLTDFASKWADMLPAGTPVPTPVPDHPDIKTLDRQADAAQIHALTHTLGVYEGAGYCAEGVYRPVPECRMKVNNVDHFCPVCTRAIVRITDWYLGREYGIWNRE